ncbi:MAG: ATP-binding cassette domain-containing protein, partial [Lachnospiraceae bacterium]|nr:ATP-binding cassette domain-containing protein [Lachnospiraceae bacterium]
MALLELKNIKKSFDDNCVLKDINVTINKGEVVSILGPSGSGKSTLLRCATMLETIDSGSIIYEDKVAAETVDDKVVYATGEKMKEIKKIFGLVFQNFNLFPHYTAIKNVMDAPITVNHMDREEAKK